MIIGVAQAAIAVALVYFTISLARSTEGYSRQVERQTGIMEKNNKLAEDALKNAEKGAERERLLKKYERLTNEMVNFIAPLYSRVRDMQVFSLSIPVQKIVERQGGQINENIRETYSYWEDYRRNKYLNQSNDVERMFNNYFAVINTYHEIRVKSPQTETDRAESKTLEEIFEINRTSLFDAMTKRYSEVQKELGELERELGIQET